MIRSSLHVFLSFSHYVSTWHAGRIKFLLRMTRGSKIASVSYLRIAL